MYLRIIATLLSVTGLLAWFTVNHGTPSAWAHGWKAPTEAAKVVNPVKSDDASIQMGRSVFQQFCANCHGPTGHGDGPQAASLDPKPADLIIRAKHHSDGDFFWKIANGKGPMPGFNKQLSDRLIWHTINFIRSLSD